ncbi:alkaline phosphatase [Bacteroidia bacterium]|nr:alkaline phosphatase [Bacteroidia bacterium]
MIMMLSLTLSAGQKVKNVIFMIGDGMGLAAVTAAWIGEGQPLAMQRATVGGFVATWSASARVTDSAAAATALACGVKTANGVIGQTPDGQSVESILTRAHKAGLATGLVDTYSITDATPAGFIAHVRSRKDQETIAAQIADSGIDVFMGGGRQFFTSRKDGRNLAAEMEAKGYRMTGTLDEALSCKRPRLGVLAAEGALEKADAGRGDYLARATEKTLELLKAASRKGFFVMIEGSMIDGGGHANDLKMVVSETLDFDRAVARAFDFADRNPGTLVVVTADHETGGLTMPAASNDKEQHALTPGVDYLFSTKGHTCTMVPLLAYGAGAEAFGGIKDNTDLPRIMARLLGLKW